MAGVENSIFAQLSFSPGHTHQNRKPGMGCSDSDDKELLFGPVCTALGDSSNGALNARECTELAEKKHEASIDRVSMAQLLPCGALWGYCDR